MSRSDPSGVAGTWAAGWLLSACDRTPCWCRSSFVRGRSGLAACGAWLDRGQGGGRRQCDGAGENEGPDREAGEDREDHEDRCRCEAQRAADGVNLRAVPAIERLDFLAEFSRQLPADGRDIRIQFD